MESAVSEKFVSLSVGAPAGTRQPKAGLTDAAGVKQIRSHHQQGGKVLIINPGWNGSNRAGDKIDEVFPAFRAM